MTAAAGLAKDKTTTAAPERVYHVFEVHLNVATRADGAEIPATTSYVLLGTQTARDDLNAIKATVGEREGSFVAIAERSINVRTRKVETVKRDLWS